MTLMGAGAIDAGATTDLLDQSMRLRLCRIVNEKSFIQGNEIQLASGRKSNFYFNMKPTMFDPEGANLIAELILQGLRHDAIDLVGGLEMGAVPLVACICQKSLGMSARPIPGFFVRKQVKDHGTKKRIEGISPGVDLRGKRVALVDDVTTSGGSVLQAAVAARDEGAIVEKVVTIVDRCEGAKENLAAQGIELVALLTVEDFQP